MSRARTPYGGGRRRSCSLCAPSPPCSGSPPRYPGAPGPEQKALISTAHVKRARGREEGRAGER
eukprot:363056-Rhodomonas_salina.1